jgi:hypothetical protein
LLVIYPNNRQQPFSLDQKLSSSLSFNYDNSSSSYSNQSDQQQQQQQQSQNQQNKTMWNWFTQNKLVNTFVEKAKVYLFFFLNFIFMFQSIIIFFFKYGVETIVTTVDPQMKDYIR